VNKTHIAPCGMNCAICMGFLREKNKCPGCRAMTREILPGCRKCIIRLCPVIKKSKVKYCYICKKFPCKRLKALDKRYRTKYNMSMVENLLFIKEDGVKKFLKKEQKKWKCKKCGAVLSCHRDFCLHCGAKTC
jgi:hypothetical protein